MARCGCPQRKLQASRAVNGQLQNWLNVVAKKEYLERLERTIERQHDCEAVHLSSVPVHEVFEDKTAWDGTVEIFKLIGHPKAKRCFAWSHREGKLEHIERVASVLEIPPVISPETAVRAQIVKDRKTDHLKG